ncbi:Endonuclease NucS [Halioglobus japonicus]|nr:Endonuclease NucS [Halioglobus japonicus]
MYKINKSSNSIQRLEKKSFSSLGFRERDHLQEWIAKQPDVLGEDLLIIQKEFSGWEDTHERLDLLAIDKQGALVIIENKLDDSGRDVTWQALKYASYCSGLSKTNISKIYQQYLDINEPGAAAEDRISEFMDGQDFEELALNKGVSQRIILIAARFRKEVTSTVLWLMNFKVRLQCFHATPFAMGDELFLNVEQIIPTPDAEEYMIGMAEKAQDDIESQTELKTRHVLRRDFWSQLIPAMNASPSNLYQNISPSVYHWIGAGSGVRGVGFNFVITKNYARTELYIDRGDKDENEFIFEQLFALKEKLEASFGGALEWERLETKRACRIKSETTGNVFDREQWEQIIAFMVDSMCRLEKAIKVPLSDISQKLKGNVKS